jgi:hypothetical protein
VPDDDDQIDHALLAALEQPRERVSVSPNCTSALLQMWPVRSSRRCYLSFADQLMKRLLMALAASRRCIVFYSLTASNDLIACFHIPLVNPACSIAKV